MIVRDFTDDDAEALLNCVRDLQAFEHALDVRCLPPEKIGPWYLEQLKAEMTKGSGRILVLELDGAVVGYVAAQADLINEDADEENYHYAYVAELGVREAHRGKGLGRALLRAAEDYVRAAGATVLRIGVMADNAPADGLYRAEGFRPRLLELEKKSLRRDRDGGAITSSRPSASLPSAPPQGTWGGWERRPNFIFPLNWGKWPAIAGRWGRFGSLSPPPLRLPSFGTSPLSWGG